MKEIRFDKLDETLFTYIYKSGLKIYMVPKKGFVKSCAYFSTDYGSTTNVFVPKGESTPVSVPDGVAHFLEHKVFEQPDGEAVFDMFSKYGAHANAYTSFNMTAYYFWCTQNFKENLKTLVSFVQTPYFTAENVAKEQGIIGQEIRMYDDDPGWRCYFNMLGGLYANHPIRRDIAGTVESISEITKETLYTCYNTFYNPSNMTLCLVGDFEPAEMKNFLDGILADEKPISEIKRIVPQEPDKVFVPQTVNKMSVAAPLYCIGFKEMDFGDDIQNRQAAAKVALSLLLGRSSKLYNKLYADGLITPSFSMDYTAEKEYGYVEISDEGVNAEAVAEKILKGISEFKFDSAALDRVKRKMFGQRLHAFEDPENYAGVLARNTVAGTDFYKSFDILGSIGEKEIKQVFEKLLRPENITISSVVPL